MQRHGPCFSGLSKYGIIRRPSHLQAAQVRTLGQRHQPSVVQGQPCQPCQPSKGLARQGGTGRRAERGELRTRARPAACLSLGCGCGCGCALPPPPPPPFTPRPRSAYLRHRSHEAVAVQPQFLELPQRRQLRRHALRRVCCHHKQRHHAKAVVREQQRAQVRQAAEAPRHRGQLAVGQVQQAQRAQRGAACGQRLGRFKRIVVQAEGCQVGQAADGLGRCSAGVGVQAGAGAAWWERARAPRAGGTQHTQAGCPHPGAARRGAHTCIEQRVVYGEVLQARQLPHDPLQPLHPACGTRGGRREGSAARHMVALAWRGMTPGQRPLPSTLVPPHRGSPRIPRTAQCPAA